MRKVDWLYHDSSRAFINHIHEINLIKQPFSDKDILEIQEKFLCNGFQYLKGQNIGQGRKIIYTFLESLAAYHDVACLTLDPQPLGEGITDLYAELCGGGYLNSFDPHYFEEYLIEQFYFDFVWIEATRSLLMSPWFEHIKEKMLEAAIDEQIPLLVFVYSEQ